MCLCHNLHPSGHVSEQLTQHHCSALCLAIVPFACQSVKFISTVSLQASLGLHIWLLQLLLCITQLAIGCSQDRMVPCMQSKITLLLQVITDQ